jgi:tetratricopeptide (TPR) repeat protein
MKKFLIFVLFLFLVGAVFGGLYWYNEKDFDFGERSVSIQPTQITLTDTKEDVKDPVEEELALLLSDYEVRKNEVGYLQLVAEKYLERRQIKKARRYLEEAKELDPSNVRTLTLLAKIHLIQKEYGEAKSLLETLPDDDIQTAFVKALYAVISGDRDIAGKHLHYVADNFPKSELGIKAQRIIDAYREFDYYKDGLPLHLKTLLARSFNQIDEPSLAIWILRDVLTEKTDYRDAWILLGYAYYNLQQFSLAEDAFHKAYELDTEKPETQYFLGLVYYALDNLSESERFFEYAVINGFEPRVQAYRKLSQVYLLNDNYEKAVSMYENYFALATDTKASDFVEPVQIYIDHLGEPNKALALAQKVSKRHSNDAMAYSLLGYAYLANKDYANTLINLERAKLLDATLPYVHLTFGRLYEAQGELEKAKEEYKQAYEKGQNEEVGNQAAELYNALIQTKSE